MFDQTTFEQVFLALRRRVEHHERTGDTGPVLDPVADAQAEALRGFAVHLSHDGGPPPLVVDWDVTHLLATWRFARAELDQAVSLFALINRVAPQAVPEPLRERVRALPAPEFAELEGVFGQAYESFARWEAAGDADALEAAVRLLSWAVAATPDGHPGKPMLLSNLCASLRTRFAVTGDPADVETAIEAGRRSVELAPADDPERWLILHNYGFALQGRLGRTRSPEDADTAVDLARQVAATVPPDVPQYALCRSVAGTAFLIRSELRDDPRDLTEAVEALRDAVRATPVGNRSQRAGILANLALALRARFERLGDPADLDAAVVEANDAIRVCPPDHIDVIHCRTALSQVLTTKFRDSEVPADADAAVDAARRAVEATPDDHPTRATRLDTLATILRRRGEHRQDLADLAEATRVHEQAVSAAPPDSAEQAGYLVNLCNTRSTVFKHTGLVSDVDAAVDAGRRSLVADGEPTPFIALIALGATLRLRAERFGSAADLDEATALLERADRSIPDRHPAQRKCLSELGAGYADRFQRTSDLADLDRGIAAMERAVELSGPHDRDRVIDVANLAGAHWLRFGRTEDLADLQAAVEWGREAVRTTPEGHRNRAGAEFHLAKAMESRFERTGSLADLDEAIRQLERAEGRAHVDPGTQAKVLSNLGAALRRRHERLDRRADADRAVELSRRAVAVVPPDHPDRNVYLSNLTTALLDRSARSGAPEDVEAAVAAGREAVLLTPDAGLARATNLTNLAVALRRRYEQTFALSDVDEAIRVHRAAVEVAPADHPLRPQALANLSTALMSRFTHAQDPAVVDEMIDAARSAVRAVPADHAVRPRYLATYANAVHQRHALTKDPQDAEAGVAALEEAVRLTPDNHPNRMLYLGNLAVALDDRYDRSQDPADLDAVVETGRAAVQAAPAGHAGGARYRYNLGRALFIRATRTGSPTDWDTAIGLFRDVARTGTAPTSLRIRAAKAWGETAVELDDWADAVAGYRAAIELLPLLAWHGLDRGDRISALGQFAGLAGAAAAAALELDDPGQALRLLEQGRGVLLGQALDARGDLGDPAAVDPDLAERMRAVRAALDSAGTPDLSDEDAERTQQVLADRRRELARDWDALLARARTLPGLGDFLRLPSLDRLRAAAADGPVVVVNTHQWRCDAMIVTATDLTTVPLPGLDVARVRDRVVTLLDALTEVGASVVHALRARRVLEETLGWLWDAVAEPVLAALPSDPARLWWCPTGLLSFLPVHAAGHHGADPRRTLLDRVTCSYTPTLRALAEARARPGAPARTLAVGQPETPGLSPLPQALAEVRALASRVPGTTLLSAAAATRAAMLAALPDYTYLHFAGHGAQDPLDAGGGALYCADHQEAGPITVADISGLRLDRAELVFLSACETARGLITVPDEAVHLAGALQLAGFTHVVATQWVVSDTHAPDVADAFYAGLADESGDLVSRRAAHALHAAVRRLRDEHANPLLWASYVHIGP